MASMQNHSSCIDCGAVFASAFDLQRHIRRGCPETQEDVTPVSKRLRLNNEVDDDDDDDPAFDTLIQEAYDKYEEKYQEKVEKYMQEGMSEKQAKMETSELLQPKYRKALMKNYMEFLYNLNLMNHSPIHYKVWQSIKEYENDGKSVKRAISLAVKDHKHLLDELLDDDNDSDRETSESEETEDDKDQDVDED